MEGAVGDIMSVIQVEAVGNLHQSHSYVRGDWHKESTFLMEHLSEDLSIERLMMEFQIGRN